MADPVWSERSPLEDAIAPGRHGAAREAAGVALCELTGFELLQVMARRGRRDAAAEASRALFGTGAPATPAAVSDGSAVLVWSGPDQFLILTPRTGGAAETARKAFAGAASLSDQSDGRALVRVSGQRARDMLSKLSSVDLDPEAFPEGAAAATAIDHAGVTLWRGPDRGEGEARFFLLIPASFAASIWHALLTAAAEYGAEVERRAFTPD